VLFGSTEFFQYLCYSILVLFIVLQWVLSKTLRNVFPQLPAAAWGLCQFHPKYEQDFSKDEELIEGMDIVFVHGLAADPTKTWIAPGQESSWIEQLLKKDLPPSLKSSTRMFYFNYESFWAYNSSGTRLRQYGAELEQALVSLPRKSVGFFLSR